MKANSPLIWIGRWKERVERRLPSGYRVLVEERDGHNVMVDNALALLAARLLNDPAVRPDLYMAFGTGSAAWDAGGTPAPAQSATVVPTEFYRQKVLATNWIYRVAAGGATSATPTNVVYYTVTLDMNNATLYPLGAADTSTYSIRAWGFVGNCTGTPAAGDLLVNLIHHPVRVINKDIILTRSIEITIRRGV